MHNAQLILSTGDAHLFRPGRSIDLRRLRGDDYRHHFNGISSHSRHRRRHLGLLTDLLGSMTLNILGLIKLKTWAILFFCKARNKTKQISVAEKLNENLLISIRFFCFCYLKQPLHIFSNIDQDVCKTVWK